MFNWKSRLRRRVYEPADPRAKAQDGEKAWYRADWQSNRGIGKADAARPALVLLEWLQSKALLTEAGHDALQKARKGENLAYLAVTESMVPREAARFLNKFWNLWWDHFGLQLTMSELQTDNSKLSLDKTWHSYTAK